MTEFVPQYYRMNSETEEAMFGRDLMNGMVVLVEAPSRRADLDARSIDVSTMSPANEIMPPHIIDQALRYNRWATITRLQTITEKEDKVRQVLFVGEYEDGLRATHTSYMTSGWLVKKDTIPEGWQPAGEHEVSIEDPNAEKIVEAMRRAASGLWRDSEGYLDKAGVAQFMEKQEKLTDITTAASLKAAGYSNVAISQIMRLTEKRVQEILERHAETPFLKSSTQKNLMGDLASGRLTLEVPPFQDGRDVTAIVKPGPNYRTATFTQAKFDRFILENKEFFSSQPSITLSYLAHLYNGEFCTREDNSVSWQLDRDVIRELATKYWATYEFTTDKFTTYNGYGLTAGQIMARDMVQRGDPTKDAGVNDIKGDGVTDETAAIQDFIERNRR